MRTAPIRTDHREAREVGVLFVDDDPDVGAAVGSVLEREIDGASVHHERSGEKALERLESDDDSVDCIVSDYRMPRMDGLELLDRVRETRPDLPFVLYTGRGDEDVASEAISAGVTDYVRKGAGPDQSRVLARRVESAVSQRRTEAALEESERRRATLVDNLPGVVYAADRERSVEFLSEGCSALTGRTPEAIEDGDVDWIDLVHPEDRERFRETVREAVRDGESFEVEYRIRGADGDVRWVLERGQPVVDDRDGATDIEGFIADVTDRRRLQERLRHERELTETALESVDDVFYVFDAEGDILRINDACVEVTGYSEAELTAMEPPDVFAPEHRDRVMESIARFLSPEAENEPVEADILTKDGERIPYEFTGSTLSLDGETLVCGIGRDVSERREYRQALSALHTATTEMIRADSKAAIHEEVVDIADRVLGFSYASAYRYDEADNALEPVTYTDGATRLFGEPTTFEPGDALAWETFTAGDAQYFPDVHEEAEVLNPETPIRAELQIPLGNHGLVLIGSTSVDAFDGADLQLAGVLATTAEAALDRTDQEQTLLERERELADHHEHLSSVESLVEVIRSTQRALVDASTIGETHEAVCRGLTAPDRHAVAWIGRYDDIDETVDPTAWDGVPAAYLDRIEADPDAPDLAFAAEAARAGDVRVVENVLEAAEWDDWRKAALARGYQSAVAVPITTGEEVTRVAVVYAEDPDAFGERARTVLRELGRFVGESIRAVERNRALVEDRELELEFAVRDDGFPFNALSTRLDSPVELEGYFRRSNGTTQAFLTATDADAETVVECLSERNAVEDAAVVATEAEDALVDVRLNGSVVLERLADADARLRSFVAADGTSTVTATFPGSVEIRSLIEDVEAIYDGTELLARRESQRTVETPRTFQARLRNRLTDRQFEALRAGHEAGFFEWPRAITGESLAEVFDIEPPTFHYHMRAAQRKLVATAFEAQ